MRDVQDEAEESNGLGIAFLRKPAVLAALILIVLALSFRAARTPTTASVPYETGSGERGPQDLAEVSPDNKLGVFGARSKFASVLGKQGDGLSTKARVMNVFRMQKALVAVTEASVFIHATLGDALPEWVRPGKSVQIEGRITEVKTKTNIYVSASRITALN